MNDRNWTAYHEAGHAVIAYILGLMPKSVTAKEDHDSAGHCTIPDMWEVAAAWERNGKWRDPLSIVRCRILSYMAGRETEVEILGGCQGLDGDDLYQIALMSDELPAFDLHQARMRDQCRTLVRRYKSSIERVAVALLTSQALDGGEIAALVNKGQY